MRLICPSCGAQYEVDESVIPDGGRDVQCSNCGHAWFQLSAKQLEAEADEAERRAAAEDVAAAGELPARPGDESPADAPEETPPEPSGAWAEPTEEPEGSADQAGPPERTRRTLDDAVRNVLREEAERETRARVAEGTSVETQPRLGLAAAIGAAPAPTGGRAAEPAQDQDSQRRAGARGCVGEPGGSVVRAGGGAETRERVARGSAVEARPELGLAAAIGAAAATTGGRAAERAQDQDSKGPGDAHDFDEDALVSR